MSNLSLYPNKIDTFFDKRDETGSNDGHYVMAEHVNLLQDAVYALENTLGTNPQSGAANLSSRLLKIEQSKTLTVPKITLYSGDPSKVNGAVSIDEAAHQFAYFDKVILKNIDEYSIIMTYARNVIEATHKLSDTKFYARIDAGKFTSDYTVEQIGILINRWINIGIDGVYYENFGYDSGVKRERQNALINLARTLDMSLVVESKNADHIFSIESIADMNLENAETLLGSQDGIVYLGFALGEETPGYQELAQLNPEMTKLIGYRNAYGTSIYTIGYLDKNLSESERNKRYYYGQTLAMLYSVDGFHCIDPSAEPLYLGFNATFPMVGNYYEKVPLIKEQGAILSRQCSLGKITVDTTLFTYNFEDIKIPLSFIDMDGDNTKINANKLVGTIPSDVAIDVVSRLNQSEALIPSAKLDLSQAGSSIIESINVVSSNKIPKIDSNAIDMLSVDHINHIVYETLVTNLGAMLESGQFSAVLKSVSANFVSALNAYFDNVIAGEGSFYGLNAGILKAGTIDSGLIGTDTITSDKLTIHANGGLNKWVGTIVLKDNSNPILTPTPKMILGKDVFKKIEHQEIFDSESSIISTTDKIGSIQTNYIVMWETWVYASKEFLPSYIFNSNTPAALYVNGVLKSNTNDTAQGYILPFNIGWNHIQVVQDHSSQLNTYFSIGVKISELVKNNENKIFVSGIERMDAYVENVTQIIGDYLKNDTIETKHLKVEEVKAGLVEAGIIQAMEAYINNLVAVDGNFERILTDMLKATTISASNIRLISEARTRNPITGELSASTGILMIDNGGMIISSKPRLETDISLEKLSIIDPVTYTYGSLYPDWVASADVASQPIIALENKSTQNIITPSDNWYSINYKEGKVYVDISTLVSQEIQLSDYYVIASYRYYSPVWPVDSQLIKMDRAGIWISSNGGGTWTSKLTGGGIKITDTAEIANAIITSAHIIDISADKIRTGILDADSSISIGSSILIDGFGTIKVKEEGIDRVILGEYDANIYGLQIITDVDKISLDKNGLNTTSGKFSINTNGSITALKGYIGGLEINEAINGLIAKVDSVEQFSFSPSTINLTGNEALTINTGTMVIKENDKTYVTVGKLNTSDYGLKVNLYDETGNITPNYIQLDQNGFKAYNSLINTININREGNVSISGEINATSGTLGNLTVNGTITAGDSIINSQGIIANSGSIGGWGLTENTLSKGNILLDSLNQKISIGTNIVFNNDGTATIGQLDIGIDGSITSANFSIDGDGQAILSGGTIAGWNINTDSLSKNNITLDSTGSIKIGASNELILNSTNGIAVNTDQLTITLAGLLTAKNINALGGKIGGWTLTEESLSTPQLSIDSSLDLININNEVLIGLYVAGKYGIKAGNVELNSTGLFGSGYRLDVDGITTTKGKIGGWEILSSGIRSNKINLDNINSAIWIGDSLSSANIRFSSDGTGKIGLVELNKIINDGETITQYPIYTPNFNIDSNGNVKIVGEIFATSGTFTGRIEAKEGWFGSDESNSVQISGSGINAGGVQVNKSGITVATTGGSVSINSSGLSIIEGIDGTSEINLNNKFRATRLGIQATAGLIANWELHTNTLTAGNIILDATSGSEKISIGSNIALNTDGSAKLGKVVINTNGTVNIGALTLNVDGTITSAGFTLQSDGRASFEGSVTATEGKIGNWNISNGAIVDSILAPKITIATDKININNQVLLGLYDGENYGIKAGNTILNSSGITATQGFIGGIIIEENNIRSSNFQEHVLGFSLDNTGHICANDVHINGTIEAYAGYFGAGTGQIKADSLGIYTGDNVGASNSSFWIASSDIPEQDIHAGDAFFKGSIAVEQDSLMNGGNIVIQSGSIVAGNLLKAHVKMGLISDQLGGEISSRDDSGEEIFRVNRQGAYFKGDITAKTGSILQYLSVGSDSSVLLSGIDSAIYLNGRTEETINQVVRLNNLGLYISIDKGQTFLPALTATGVNANAINDGVLTITDSGYGASGISIQQWNDVANEYVENVAITPRGIDVYNGAITVHSDQTGEILIGGGYLRVKGLDMGVVTSNNFIGNGIFSMISDNYGLLQTNKGEVFLGSAQSSGGAVSNPTYHYAGWPDYGDRDPHTAYTYNVNEDGTLNNYDPEDIFDPNYPVVTRTSFNPQWTAVHPTFPFAVIPNDACNFITVIDKNGHLVRHLKAWKSGLFGIDFTPDGTRMVVCGDDIDRKRAPWDMVIFDVSSSDPMDWHIIGNIPVGEFPSKVVCDDKGFAYVTVSLDDSVYKLDIVNMRVEKVIPITDPRRMHTSPMGIAISNDYSKIYVACVVVDSVYEIPTDTFDHISRIFSVIPYVGNRGIPHDVHTLSDGRLIVSSSSTTDGYIVILNPNKEYGPSDMNGVGHIVTAIDTWIDGTMDGIGGYEDTDIENLINKLAYPGGLTPEERDRWNFFSSTTNVPHPDPTKKIIYVTVTNRCMISVLDYSVTPEFPNGELRELQRVPSGSNPSGISVSTDGSKLYVSNHHFHTYPLGANKIWGYRSSDNYYATDNLFDTGQKYYNANPSGMITTDGDKYLWIANRATNDISIVDVRTNGGYWSDQSKWITIPNVGSKPYEIKINHAKTKVYVSNDDSSNIYDPDFITVIDKSLALSVPESSVIDKIYVADRPMGIEISPDDKFLYVACSKDGIVQKANLLTNKVIDSVKLNCEIRHLKLHGNKLYITCFDTDKVACLDTASLDIITMMNCDKSPSQMEIVNNKLYVTNEGADTVNIFDTVTNTFIKRIETGSQPKPIGYNSVKNLLYIGNAGEGSVCIIDPTIDEVIEWCMTGDNPEYIIASEDGEYWYASAHGPEDIVSYGIDTPYTGDAYIDNNGKSHKYGAEYWMPSRSEWVRGSDNTLTSFSSVEFWPSSQLAGKKGYAQLSVLGMFDAFTRLEQDVYPLTNTSDGSCEYISELIDIEEGKIRELQEDVADYSGIPGGEKRRILVTSATNFNNQFVEDIDYKINYENNTIAREGVAIPPSRVKQNTDILVGSTPVSLIARGSEYNNIKVMPLNQTGNEFKENEDYILNKGTNKISRIDSLRTYSNQVVSFTPSELFLQDIPIKADSEVVKSNSIGTIIFVKGVDYSIDYNTGSVVRLGDGNINPNQEVYIDYIRTSKIKDGTSVTVQYNYILNIRYYYHPHKRNYEDVVLSTNMFWKWPRPENQYVKMEVDELVPKFIVVDNDQIDPWTPIFDLGKSPKEIVQYKGLRYSSIKNRIDTAVFSSSSIPISGSIDSLKIGSETITLQNGVQYIVADLSAIYYINEIIIEHPNDGRTIYEPKVEISMDGITWETIYSQPESPYKYIITFPKTFGLDTYGGAKRVKYIRSSTNGSSLSSENKWKQIKAMGDWKLNKTYVFASNTVWDSEGRREMYLTMTNQDKIRFDKVSEVIDPLQADTAVKDRIKYRIYYTDPAGGHNHNGEIQAFNIFNNTEYNGLREGAIPKDGVVYDFMYDYLRNTMWRTPNSRIISGEEVRILYRFVQEDLSNTPLCVRYKNPDTGIEDPTLSASVAESDITGAWVEWEFHNDYRCDWYIGWVADIGLGDINIYLDGKLIHSMSQHAAKVERYSQITQDLPPGNHTIKLVQQQGTVNFDIIKLEDYQLFYTNSSTVASPSTNPVELFSWYATKLSPGKARKYLGRGSQVTSGAYDNPRTDRVTNIPNNQTPLKYRIRFQTTLEGRGEPIAGIGGYGGEAGAKFTFERGSVMITDVVMEHGVNPTYWRMAPSVDKYPGFMIESWDVNEHDKTGIQEHHIAEGAVTSSKIKAFSIMDRHIDNNAEIQESKLLLNYPTHNHNNKNFLDSIDGNEEGFIFENNIKVNGVIKEMGKHEVVHRRPLYGLAGDLQFQTNSSTWELLNSQYSLFGHAIPEVKDGAVRYYKLYSVYGDNILQSDTVRPRIRLKDKTTSSIIYEWVMPATFGAANGRRDSFSPQFTTESLNDIDIEVTIQNDAITYSGTAKEVGIEWLELVAYDVYEEAIN